MPTVLVVDDDRKLTEMLRRTLAYSGYQVLTALDGPGALELARAQQPDLIILDWMLPGLSGIAVAELIRAEGDTPILMLTARDAVLDRVAGLDSGADDYLVKPFAPEELLARVRALLRRSEPGSGPPLSYADLTLTPATREVSRAGATMASGDAQPARVRPAQLPAAPSTPGVAARADHRCSVGCGWLGRSA
jgi:two-component system response regulator MprA